MFFFTRVSFTQEWAVARADSKYAAKRFIHRHLLFLSCPGNSSSFPDYVRDHCVFARDRGNGARCPRAFFPDPTSFCSADSCIPPEVKSRKILFPESLPRLASFDAAISVLK